MRHNHDSAFVPVAEVPYAVGRGRPPQHTRFRPGESGNPRGRPKGARNLQSYLLDALNEKIAVTENGRSRQIPKAEVIAKQLVNKAAAKGDLAATKLLLHLLDKGGGCLAGGPQAQSEAGPPPKVSDPSPWDNVDYEKLSTEDLQVLHEAMRILDGKEERPPIPLPPEDPGAKANLSEARDAKTIERDDREQ